MGDEALCRRCGRCCHEKLILPDGTRILTAIACEHFDPATRLCRVYAGRHDENGRCLSIEDAIRYRALPADCPYVADRPGYEAPTPLAERPDCEALVLREFGRLR